MAKGESIKYVPVSNAWVVTYPNGETASFKTRALARAALKAWKASNRAEELAL